MTARSRHRRFAFFPENSGAWLLMFIVAVVLGGYCSLGLLRWNNSRSWPVVQGTVLESAVGARGVLASGTKGSMHAGWEPSPSIKYQFTWNSRTHVGSRYELFGKPNDGLPANRQKLERQFPQGSRIRVHVNPGDPTDTFIRETRPFRHGLGALFASLLFVAAITGALCQFREHSLLS